MPGFETIIGQQLPVRILQTLLSSATLPHAMLFTGMAGVGKQTTARIVAMALNCGNKERSPSNPCGRCRSCRQILSGHHPDVILVEPHGNLLRIDQIRKLLATLTMKPFSAEYRVVIITEAQTMNPEAANALLKILEEPPANTILVLTASQQSDLLPTIVSRCRHIRFRPLGLRDMMTLLNADPEIADEFAQTAATLSGGSLKKARQLAMPVWRDNRDWLVRATGLDKPRSTGGENPSMATALAFAAQLAEKKDQVQNLLEILKTWIRDLCIWPYHPDLVINADCKVILAQVRAGLDDNELLIMWQALEKAQKDIAGKANLRLSVDVMALSMAGYISR